MNMSIRNTDYVQYESFLHSPFVRFYASRDSRLAPLYQDLLLVLLRALLPFPWAFFDILSWLF